MAFKVCLSVFGDVNAAILSARISKTAPPDPNITKCKSVSSLSYNKLELNISRKKFSCFPKWKKISVQTKE